MKRSVLVILVVSLLMPGFVFADSEEKIAVAAEGKEAASKVSSPAARAPWFLIFDKNGNLLEAVENPYTTVRRGAAPSVLEFLSEKGVTMIVAGTFGHKMIQGVERQKMRRLEFNGSARDAIKKALEPAK